MKIYGAIVHRYGITYKNSQQSTQGRASSINLLLIKTKNRGLNIWKFTKYSLGLKRFIPPSLMIVEISNKDTYKIHNLWMCETI